MAETELDKKMARLRSGIEARVRGEFQRRHRLGRIPYPPEYLAERSAFVEKWEAMTAEGEEKKFLEWTNDYDGSRLVPVTALDYEGPVEWLETEEQLEARIQKEVDRRVNYRLEELLEKAGIR